MTAGDGEGRRGLVWVAGLVVAVGAGVATAHGLYEVAIAARVPAGIAWLYPLITDGLALVAYATTARLQATGRRYAWTVVVLAAGLSGLAQASYLAGGVGSAPTMLRFGVGAWPAVAAAIVAHLLHLLGPAGALTPTSQPAPGHSPRTTDERSDGDAGRRTSTMDGKALDGTHGSSEVGRALETGAYTQAGRPAGAARDGAADWFGTAHGPAHQAAAEPDVVQSPVGVPVQRVEHPPVQPAHGSVSTPAAPARDRARVAAQTHRSRHGELPTVSLLAQLAQVARGTAGTVLKELRAERPALQIVRTTPDKNTDR